MATEMMTDEQAFEWLMQQPGRFDTNVSALAREWGWNRTRVRRRLGRWSEQGHITREIDRDGLSIIAIHMDTVVNSPVIAPPCGEYRVYSTQALGALALGFLALAVAWYGLRINAWYGASLGKDAASSAMLAGLSFTADAIALLLPAAARTLAAADYRTEARTAWTLWLITMAAALMAAIGFASVNIADSTAGRDKIASETASLTAQAHRLETERAGIHEARTVAELDAEILAQGSVLPVWGRTSGCNDVTRAQSAALCAPIQTLRKARAEAVRIAEIDAGLADARRQLAGLPAITAADPQAEMAARLVGWASRGMLTPDATDIAMVRIAGMTLLPQISGLVLMLAFGLWRARRDDGLCEPHRNPPQS